MLWLFWILDNIRFVVHFRFSTLIACVRRSIMLLVRMSLQCSNGVFGQLVVRGFGDDFAPPVVSDADGNENVDVLDASALRAFQPYLVL